MSSAMMRMTLGFEFSAGVCEQEFRPVSMKGTDATIGNKPLMVLAPALSDGGYEVFMDFGIDVTTKLKYFSHSGVINLEGFHHCQI